MIHKFVLVVDLVFHQTFVPHALLDILAQIVKFQFVLEL